MDVLVWLLSLKLLQIVQGSNDYPICLSWTFQNNTLQLSCSSDQPSFTFINPLGKNVSSCRSSSCTCHLQSCSINGPIWDGVVWQTVLTVNTHLQISGVWKCVVQTNTDGQQIDSVHVTTLSGIIPIVYLEVPQKVSIEQAFMVTCIANTTPVEPSAVIFENGKIFSNITRTKIGCFSSRHGSVCDGYDDCICSNDSKYYGVKRVIGRWWLQIFKCQMEFANVGKINSICGPVASFSEPILQITHNECINSTTVDIVCESRFPGFEPELIFGFLSWKHEVKKQFVRYITGYINGNRSTIQLPLCNLQDYGEYTCRIWLNSNIVLGSSASYVKTESKKVIVSGPPTCFSGDNYWLDNSAVLICNFYSEPYFLTIKWSKSGKRIESSEKFNLSIVNNVVLLKSYGIPVHVDGYTAKMSINDIIQEDFGFYIAVVENDFGQCNCSFKFDITGLIKGECTTNIIAVLLAFLVILLLSSTVAMIVYTKRRLGIINTSSNVLPTQEIVEAYNTCSQYETIDESTIMQDTNFVIDENNRKKTENVQTRTRIEKFKRTIPTGRQIESRQCGSESTTKSTKSLDDTPDNENAYLNPYTPLIDNEYLNPYSALKKQQFEKHEHVSFYEDVSVMYRRSKSNSDSQLFRLPIKELGRYKTDVAYDVSK